MNTKSTIANRKSEIHLDVVCLGELLIDFVPSEPGVPLVESEFLRLAPGGAPANVAVALKRLGLSSAFIGKVGNDPFGRYLKDVLRRENLDLQLFTLSHEAQTRLAFVTNEPDEKQRFLFYGNPGADELLRSQDIKEEYIRRSKGLHFGSISLIREPVRSATLEAISMARRHNLLVSFDPNLRPPLWPGLETARREILKAMRHCHLLKMNQSEWEFLFPGKRFEESFALLKRKGIRLAAITLGAGGSMIATSEACVRVKGKRVKVVDTTGAGDGYMAGLLYSLLNIGTEESLGRDQLTKVAQFASCVGTLTCTKAGAIPAFPTLAEVERFSKVR